MHPLNVLFLLESSQPWKCEKWNERIAIGWVFCIESEQQEMIYTSAPSLIWHSFFTYKIYLLLLFFFPFSFCFVSFAFYLCFQTHLSIALSIPRLLWAKSKTKINIFFIECQPLLRTSVFLGKKWFTAEPLSVIVLRKFLLVYLKYSSRVLSQQRNCTDENFKSFYEQLLSEFVIVNPVYELKKSWILINCMLAVWELFW